MTQQTIGSFTVSVQLLDNFDHWVEIDSDGGHGGEYYDASIRWAQKYVESLKAQDSIEERKFDYRIVVSKWVTEIL